MGAPKKLAATRWKDAMTRSQDTRQKHISRFDVVVRRAHGEVGMKEKLEALRECPAFQGLPPSVLGKLAGCMRAVHMAPHSSLAKAGAIAHGLFLISSGEVKCLESAKKAGEGSVRRQTQSARGSDPRHAPRKTAAVLPKQPNPKSLSVLPALQPLRSATPRGRHVPRGLEIALLGPGQLVGDLEMEAGSNKWQHSYVSVGKLTAFHIDTAEFEKRVSPFAIM